MLFVCTIFSLIAAIQKVERLLLTFLQTTWIVPKIKIDLLSKYQLLSIYLKYSDCVFEEFTSTYLSRWMYVRFSHFNSIQLHKRDFFLFTNSNNFWWWTQVYTNLSKSIFFKMWCKKNTLYQYTDFSKYMDTSCCFSPWLQGEMLTMPLQPILAFKGSWTCPVEKYQ